MTPVQLSTLSLHDALPILCQLLGRRPVDGAVVRLVEHVPALLADAFQLSMDREIGRRGEQRRVQFAKPVERHRRLDRKSTRLNSSHLVISYAVFCLKKKNE